MFYIGSVQGDKYGVVDTEDCVVEYYSIDDLMYIGCVSGITIRGLDLNSGRVTINEDTIRLNILTLRKLLINKKRLLKFQNKGYTIGTDNNFSNNFTLFVCDMGNEDDSNYIFLTYNKKTNKYGFIEGTEIGVLLKDNYSKQLSELGLFDLKFDTYMTFDEMLSYINSGLKNSFRRKLDKASLEPLLQCVDQPEGWNFPDGRKTLKKAVELANNGYFIVIDGEYMCPRELERKLEVDLRTPNTLTPYVKYYSFVEEYTDNKNKVFYCNLGAVECANLM